MKTLTLKKGGLLETTEWVYDDEKEEGSYVTEPAGDFYPAYLNNVCELDDDVTLRDVFLLLDRDLDFYSILIGNWVDEIVREGLDTTPETCKDIDYLELCWWFTRSKHEGKVDFTGHLFPDFHGYGNWDECPGVEPGTKGNIGVSMTPSYKLLDLPLKLKKDTAILFEDLDFKWKTIQELNAHQETEYLSVNDCSYTLYHILYGIIWELSFHGGPKNRDDHAKVLKDCVDKIKEGDYESVPIDELLDEED